MSSGKQGMSLSAATFRVGLGSDLHRLIPGEGFRLGGVWIPCAFGVEAVSDGDVLLHALVDALLGACGWGDIGEWFPEASTERGQASSAFVERVLERMREQGAGVVNVDATVDLQTVRLSGWKQAVREHVAALLGIPAERVNVKAKTAEGLGPVGEGRAISASVAALLSTSAASGGA